MTIEENNCVLRKVGDAEGGARLIHCATCGITGKAYVYPDPRSNIRCFLTEPWPDDQQANAPELLKGIGMGLTAILIAFVAASIFWAIKTFLVP